MQTHIHLSDIVSDFLKNRIQHAILQIAYKMSRKYLNCFFTDFSYLPLYENESVMMILRRLLNDALGDVRFF